MIWQKFLRSLTVAVFVALAGLPACSTYRIMRYDTGARPGQDSVSSGYRRIPGVPFYAKRAVCRQETVYQQDLVRLSFKVHEIFYNEATALPDSTVLRYTDERMVSRATLAAPELATLRLQPTSQADWQNQAATLKNLPQVDLARWQESSDRLLVSNRTAPFLYVDYENPYYLNADRPLMGSSSVNATLAADGTLTTAVAEGTDSTLGTILSAIPTTALLSEAFNLDTGGEQRDEHPKFRAVLEATVVPVLHTLSTWQSAPMPCWDSHAPITPRVDNVGYAYSRMVGPAAPAEEKKSNAITVSGQIGLPQPKP
jgi:hypothetical protein